MNNKFQLVADIHLPFTLHEPRSPTLTQAAQDKKGTKLHLQEALTGEDACASWVKQV
jgi:hypothetical protein